ncbi:MAG: gluconokinase [Pseudomonadota bacterium]
MVVMGVAGCGKTSVGHALADRLGTEYVDGDELHPPENIKKMSSGIPLNDEDRWPWLKLVGERLGQSGGECIIGCSALKRIYRDRIREFAGGQVMFIHLAGSKELIAARMNSRTGHFMPPELLDSQFAALEPPTKDEIAITVDIDQDLVGIVDEVVRSLEQGKQK